MKAAPAKAALPPSISQYEKLGILASFTRYTWLPVSSYMFARIIVFVTTGLELAQYIAPPRYFARFLTIVQFVTYASALVR